MTLSFLDLWACVHGKLPDFFFMSADLLGKFGLVDVIKKDAALFSGHDYIFVTWQDEQTEHVRNLDRMFKCAFK